MNGQRKTTAAWVGGMLACILLLVAGIAYVVIGINGRSEVQNNLKREQIVGTPDMKPGGIKTDLQIALPTCDVAGVTVDTGQKAKCFASYMRIHALEATGGKTFSQMDRFLLPNNAGTTSDQTKAAKDPKTGAPVENAARNIWVTQTALSSALNMAFFAEQVSLFAIVVGILMIIIGIGLGVITLSTWGLAPWKKTGAPVAVPAT
ncbi:MAG: hypothetical protein U0Y82_10115 [Thermoleophilia bacterium]